MTTRTHTSAELPAPFFDFAMSVLFVFVALFLVSTMDTPRPPQEGAITPKAEFLVEMTWDDGSTDDVDLYARGPDGRVVFFGNRTTSLMFLDRDNLGSNNAVATAGGVLELKDRREIVTIRALASGDYAFNAFCHRCGGRNAVKLRVLKLNPYSVVAVAEATLDQQGQERTMVAMSVGADGVASPYADQVKMVGR